MHLVDELQNYVIQTRAPTVLYRLKFGEPADVFYELQVIGGCYPAGHLCPVGSAGIRPVLVAFEVSTDPYQRFLIWCDDLLRWLRPSAFPGPH